jgi:hypothetical protein
VNIYGTTYADVSYTTFWSFTTVAPTPVTLTNLRATSLPQGIQLNWQTVQEIALLGFNIFRADTVDGPQVKINPELIPGINPGQLRGNNYLYLDATVETGKTYYYWIEWVGNSSSEFYGPMTARVMLYKVWLPLGIK